MSFRATCVPESPATLTLSISANPDPTNPTLLTLTIFERLAKNFTLRLWFVWNTNRNASLSVAVSPPEVAETLLRPKKTYVVNVSRIEPRLLLNMNRNEPCRFAGIV